MGLLVIENHLGIETTIDAMRPLNWTKILAGKAGDVPDRLVLTLAPGHYEFVDHCVLHCRGIIKVDLLAGEMFVSPIWENDRTDEYVFPLTAPDGCSQ